MTNLLLAIIYLAFVSLGLPDALLGSSWPTMYVEFSVPVSYAGIVSMTIAAGTIVSSLMSDRLTLRLGTGKVTAASVALTAIALAGFAFSHSFWMLCLWAVPYGLGAGAVDASLNNYVALHYASRHMSWLHCMWGVGASLGPSILGFALTNGQTWNAGYGIISALQVVLTIVLVFSLPLWKSRAAAPQTPQTATEITTGTTPENSPVYADEPNENIIPSTQPNTKPMRLREIVAIPGVKEVILTFFCYCTVETTAGLWASSYMVLHAGIATTTAASFAALFYLGITLGRAASGFATLKLTDAQMTRIGEAIIVMGIALLFLPLATTFAPVGLVFIGLGCAPIYPSIIHSTPANFGAHRSQAIIGVQMASAYVGTCVMPPLFGLIANNISIALLPAFLLIATIVMAFGHERVLRKTAQASI